MTVRELMDQLAKCNPEAEIYTWAEHQSGEAMDDVGAIKIVGVVQWEGEDLMQEEFIHINLKLPD